MPVVGDQVAVARALGDLAQRLLMAATGAIAAANDRAPDQLTR